MTRHYVEFCSPGTFFPETTRLEIESWDVERAMAMAHTVKERYGAVPHSFQFLTRSRGEGDLDAEESAWSNRYWLGGTVEPASAYIRKHEGDERYRNVIANIRSNGITRVITNTNSWLFTGEFGEGDVLLDWEPAPAQEDSNG